MKLEISHTTTDPPKAPSLRIESTSFNSVTVSWRVEGDPLLITSSSKESTSSSMSSSHNSIEESISGFILYYRRNEETSIDNWESIRLSKHQRRHVLSSLLCGSKYMMKMNAFNEVGSSSDTEVINFCTDGRPALAPDKYSFITSNITDVQLSLSSWKDGGCPIDHFSIQFKPKYQPEWILLSNHILPQQDTIFIRELNAGTWYDLLVLVNNEAGTTEANYIFATLTTAGATIPPMLLSHQSLNNIRNGLDSVMLLIPSLCAVIVLFLVGGVAVWMLQRKRLLLDIDGHSMDHCKCLSIFP
jgi:hypothetical protein